ncbi:MAG TPA: pseudouridine-5'-phosphate glycosidase, partial [Candidatus Lustribacter sp.]
PLRLDSAAEIAHAIRTQRALGYPSGTLIANPVDAADEIPANEIGAHIEAAVAAAAATGISGKDVTPFLLDRLLELTGGRSLMTNIALIKSNARLAAAVAVALTAPL